LNQFVLFIIDLAHCCPTQILVACVRGGVGRRGRHEGWASVLQVACCNWDSAYAFTELNPFVSDRASILLGLVLRNMTLPWRWWKVTFFPVALSGGIMGVHSRCCTAPRLPTTALLDTL